jgi:hypothetical protein
MGSKRNSSTNMKLFISLSSLAATLFFPSSKSASSGEPLHRHSSIYAVNVQTQKKQEAKIV